MAGVTIIQHTWTASLGPRPIKLAPGSVDLVFADPPYNQNVRYEDDPTLDNIEDIDYIDMVIDCVDELFKLMRPGATLWWLCPVAHVDWIGDVLECHVGPREYLICWHERFAQYQQRRLTRDFRLLYCHRKPGALPTFNPDAIRTQSERLAKGDKRADPRGRVPGTVWTVRRLQGTSKDRVSWHPTQLPPEPLERIVAGWTNPGDTVLDPFAGSGTMGIAAKKLDRNFIGVDRSASYCELMRQRLA